jgi:hypothetical protein
MASAMLGGAIAALTKASPSAARELGLQSRARLQHEQRKRGKLLLNLSSFVSSG